VRVIAFAIPLAVVALAFACSSSTSSGAHDAGLIDALGEAESEIDATADDASEEQAATSPVFTCNEAQLAFATSMACGQCVAQKCAKYLQACTNCITCQQMLASGCSACSSMCFGGGGPGPGGPGPGFPFDAAGPPVIGSE
jgi:hypothetical protein